MATHTPGPWKAQCDCRSYKNKGIFTGRDPDENGNRNAWGIYARTRIAVLEESRQGMPQEQIDANARLIAAAPELLEELRLMAEAYADELARQNNGTPVMSMRLTKARAAIAKAESR